MSEKQEEIRGWRIWTILRISKSLKSTSPDFNIAWLKHQVKIWKDLERISYPRRLFLACILLESFENLSDEPEYHDN